MKEPRPQLQFGDTIAYHGTGPFALGIRWKTNGWANHVGFALAEDKILHAYIKDGLQVRGLESVDNQPCAIFRPRIEGGFCPDTQARYMTWLDNEFKTSKPYDKWAIAGFIFGSWHNFLNSKSAWFCSEMNTASYQQCYYPLFNAFSDTGSQSPTSVAVNWRLKPIWHNLPKYLTDQVPIEWQ